VTHSCPEVLFKTCVAMKLQSAQTKFNSQTNSRNDYLYFIFFSEWH